MKKAVIQNWNKWGRTTDPSYKKRDILAFDIDDTLTTNGILPSFVFEAFETLKKRKIRVVLVTGRPGGWADALIKLLPIDAIACENGAALFYWPQGFLKRKKIDEPQKLFWNEQQKKYTSQAPQGLDPRLKAIKDEVLKEFSSVKVASDQFCRLYDLAIDFAEEVSPPLSFQEAQKIYEVFAAHGAQAKFSSIHVNGWFGVFSKESGLKHIVENAWNKDLNKNVIYVGDSPNDSALFDAINCSVGVANIKEFLGVVPMSPPKYVTQKKCSAGALEVIQRVLRVRLKSK